MDRTRENRRVERIFLKKPLRVWMGSIGNTIRYELMTRNVSINGFFLDFSSPGRFPFTPSSIMEVWLDVGQDKPLFFNGKMARVVQKDDPNVKETGPGIAIKIVQIDAENEGRLRDFLDSISEKSKGKGKNLVS